MAYANKTTVPIVKTKAEIEQVCTKYGAAQFYSGFDTGLGVGHVGFTIKERMVQFNLPLPKPAEKIFTHYRDRHGYERIRSASSAQQEWEQACRSRWRALFLVIKAKLEAVECGITTFEQEFLGNIVVGNGQLVADIVQPRLAQVYATGNAALLLADGRGS